MVTVRTDRTEREHRGGRGTAPPRPTQGPKPLAVAAPTCLVDERVSTTNVKMGLQETGSRGPTDPG